MTTLTHHLRQFTRDCGRHAAVTTLLYSTVVAASFWGGGALSLGIAVTLNFTIACLCLAHVAWTEFFGASEFCLSPVQRVVMLSTLLPLIFLLILYAHANVASSQQFTQVFLPLLFVGLISVYVDFMFAGMIEKMVPRS
jgi:hypothetical protein